MAPTPPGPFKPRLLALVAHGLAEQRAFIEQLSDAERAAVGEPDAWSAKDNIAHNAAWKADAAREIAASLRGEAYLTESITVFNPRVFAEQRHQSWDAILARVEQADAALRSALEECSETDLTDPARFPWREGLPLWTTAFVSGYEHPAEHYAQYYLESGDVGRATLARETVVETARRLIGGTEQFGYVVYNLGCFYANTGQPDQAIAALRESFAHVPGLREGIAEDAELAALRDNLAFRALPSEVATAPDR
jgi:tetratricopeptide (TPR) repeat protein